jgi:hypothetical protein
MFGKRCEQLPLHRTSIGIVSGAVDLPNVRLDLLERGQPRLADTNWGEPLITDKLARIDRDIGAWGDHDVCVGLG